MAGQLAQDLQVGMQMLAMNLACFFQELIRLDFTREEALELTLEWQRSFMEFHNNPRHAGEEE